MSGFFNLIKHAPKIAKTVASPITHAKNVISSTFRKKPKFNKKEEVSKYRKEALKFTKENTAKAGKAAKEAESRIGKDAAQKIGRETKSKMVKDFLKYNRNLKAKGGRAGFKGGGSTNGNGKKGGLGMQSVVHGLDKNPNVTAADPKAKFIAAAKSDKPTKPMGKSIIKSKKEKNKRII